MSAHSARANQLAEKLNARMQREDNAMVRQIVLLGIAALFAAAAIAIDFATWG